MEKTYLGVDLGGTKLLVGEMTEKGEILSSRQYPSGPLPQKEALDLICQSLEDYLKTGRPHDAPPPAALGVGLVGRIDSETGRWLEIEPGRDVELNAAEVLREKFHLPCFLDNDVRSAAKAELLFGNNSQNMIYLNVGTGVAAGFVVHGKLLRGGHSNAGEVGHTTSGIAMRAPCVCGRPDCVESVASGSGLDKCARILVSQYPGTKLKIPEEGRVSAKDIFALYGQDPLCTLLTDHAAQALANLIMNLVRFADPEWVVLGGGVLTDGFLYPKILERLSSHTVRFVKDNIVLTHLDPAKIGLMGACSNAILGLKTQ